MAQARTQSGDISSGQIGQIQDRLGTTLRNSGLRRDSVQRVLSTRRADLMHREMFALVRRHVEEGEEEIVRRVRPAYDLLISQIVAQLGWGCLQAECVPKTPKDDLVEADVVLLKISLLQRSNYVSFEDLAAEVDAHGLKPADPYAVLAINQDDPRLPSTHPNSTFWKDEQGLWRTMVVRNVVDRGPTISFHVNDNVWRGTWWMACVLKE